MWIDTLIKPRDIISVLILLENPIFHNAQSDRRQMLSNQNELEIESYYSMLCAFGKLTNSFWMIEFRIGLSCLFQIESFNAGMCNEKFRYTRRTHSYTNTLNTNICLFICWHCFARTEENEVWVGKIPGWNMEQFGEISEVHSATTSTSNSKDTTFFSYNKQSISVLNHYILHLLFWFVSTFFLLHFIDVCMYDSQHLYNLEWWFLFPLQKHRNLSSKYIGLLRTEHIIQIHQLRWPLCSVLYASFTKKCGQFDIDLFNYMN